jgi:hypothetical protein
MATCYKFGICASHFDIGKISSSDVSGQGDSVNTDFSIHPFNPCSSRNLSFACCHQLTLFKRIEKTYRIWQNQLTRHCCNLMRFNISARWYMEVIACLFLVSLQMCCFSPTILSVTAAHNHSPTLSKLSTKFLSILLVAQLAMQLLLCSHRTDYCQLVTLALWHVILSLIVTLNLCSIT